MYVQVFLAAIVVNLFIGTGLYLTMSDNDLLNLPKDPLSRWIACVYFSVVTFATIGYGDIMPISNFARIVITIYILCIALGIFAVITSEIEKRSKKNAA